MKHLFIINPMAGKGKALKYIKKIEELFKGRESEYYIEITKAAGHATEIASTYTKQQDLVVHSIGGDGTMNEVLNGMADSNSVLSIIPGGSGNDFIRSICNDINYDDILERTLDGEVKAIDIGKANDMYFMNISSVGIDAEIVDNAIKLKKFKFLPGGISYLLSIFITVFFYKSKRLSIKLDNEQFSSETLLMAIANGLYYGGGMKVAPKAEIDDGIFDICHISKAPIWKILMLFPKLIKGNHENIREVTFYKSKSVYISSDEEITFNADGELFKLKEVNIINHHKKLKVLIPKQ